MKHRGFISPYLLVIALLAGGAPAFSAATQVSLSGTRWHINGRVVNPGSPAEGLLMNVRMVNATFEDRNDATLPAGFDAEANTDRFISHIADYAAHGVNAFTLCLQGGMPGYEDALNSAFNADGSLRPDYLRRVERVIRACDERGVVVILGLLYQRQTKLLRDEDAVRAAVVNGTRWVARSGFSNVVIEIANEYPHGGFAHPVIRDPKGQAGLIRLARETAPGLLFTASGYGRGVIHPEVAEACDFLTPHWNGTKVEDIPARLAVLKQHGKPMVCNEDDKTGTNAVAALKASVENGCAYGLMLKKHNQYTPFQFDGAADDPVFYAALAELTRSPDQLAVAASRVIRERDGRVEFEAEDGTGDWKRIALPGGHAIQDPGEGTMRYEIKFTTAGRYYVFLLAKQGPTGPGKDNDCVLMLNGERLFGSDHRTRPEGMRVHGDWKWSHLPKGPGGHTPDAIRNDPVYFRVPAPGRYTLEMAHRSANFAVDKILMKRDDPVAPK
jgi:hypothetical protein